MQCCAKPRPTLWCAVPRCAVQVFLTDDHLVLVMEYAAGGDLLERVARSRWLSEEEARWFFQQTMFAIDYCHRMVSGPRG